MCHSVAWQVQMPYQASSACSSPSWPWCAGLCGCSIWLASRQVRIHDSRDCQVYLRTASRPIIEDCSGMAFAPWQALSYEGAEGQLQAAQLQQDSGLWSQVQDFKWLRATPSPHWCVSWDQTACTA